MSNKRFGLDKERLIVNDLKEEGFDIVARTAGSHSAIDIFAVHKEKKEIRMIQSKRTRGEDIYFIKPSLKKKLENEMGWLNGKFSVTFEAL